RLKEPGIDVIDEKLNRASIDFDPRRAHPVTQGGGVRERHRFYAWDGAEAALKRVEISLGFSWRVAVSRQTRIYRNGLPVFETRRSGHRMIECAHQQSRHNQQDATGRNLGSHQDLPHGGSAMPLLGNL